MVELYDRDMSVKAFVRWDGDDDVLVVDGGGSAVDGLSGENVSLRKSLSPGGGFLCCGGTTANVPDSLALFGMLLPLGDGVDRCCFQCRSYVFSSVVRSQKR